MSDEKSADASASSELCGGALSIPGVLLSLGKAPTLASIIVALAQTGLDSVSPSDISDLYSAKDNAIKYSERLKG